MSYEGITRDEYGKLQEFLVKPEYFEKVSNKGRGPEFAWSGNYHFSAEFDKTWSDQRMSYKDIKLSISNKF